MPISDNLRLRVYPTSDPNFRADVERAVATLPPGSPDAALREQLKARLREWYRVCDVVGQDEIAHMSVDPTRTWYVYRDGRIRTTDGRRERLYDALASARRSVDASERLMEDSSAVAREAGYRERGASAHGAPPPTPAGQSTRRTSRTV